MKARISRLSRSLGAASGAPSSTCLGMRDIRDSAISVRVPSPRSSAAQVVATRRVALGVFASSRMCVSTLYSPSTPIRVAARSEEHTSELQSRGHLVCRLLLEKKKETNMHQLQLQT